MSNKRPRRRTSVSRILQGSVKTPGFKSLHSKPSMRKRNKGSTMRSPNIRIIFKVTMIRLSELKIKRKKRKRRPKNLPRRRLRVNLAILLRS